MSLLENEKVPEQPEIGQRFLLVGISAVVLIPVTAILAVVLCPFGLLNN